MNTKLLLKRDEFCCYCGKIILRETESIKDVCPGKTVEYLHGCFKSLAYPPIQGIKTQNQKRVELTLNAKEALKIQWNQKKERKSHDTN